MGSVDASTVIAVVALIGLLLQLFKIILDSKLKAQIDPIKQDIKKLKEGQANLEKGQAKLGEGQKKIFNILKPILDERVKKFEKELEDIKK